MTFQFPICILSREGLLNALSMQVPIILPSGHFLRQQLHIGNATIQTLPGKNSNVLLRDRGIERERLFLLRRFRQNPFAFRRAVSGQLRQARGTLR